jgi:hypothetical protein
VGKKNNTYLDVEKAEVGGAAEERRHGKVPFQLEHVVRVELALQKAVKVGHLFGGGNANAKAGWCKRRSPVLEYNKNWNQVTTKRLCNA